MGIGAIAIHEIELGGLVTLVTVVVTVVGDELAVGRNGGRCIRTFAAGERAEGAVGDGEFVDFRVEKFSRSLGNCSRSTEAQSTRLLFARVSLFLSQCLQSY